MFATEIDFAQPGIYFLVLNYTATDNTSVVVFVGDIEVPTILPSCSKCLIMLAGQNISFFDELIYTRITNVLELTRCRKNGGQTNFAN